MEKEPLATMRISLYHKCPGAVEFSLLCGSETESSHDCIGIESQNKNGIDILADNARSFIKNWIEKNFEATL